MQESKQKVTETRLKLAENLPSASSLLKDLIVPTIYLEKLSPVLGRH